MGLFSKKEYVCEKCGTTFSARFEPAYILCKKCWNEKCKEDLEIEESVEGYIKYGSKVLFKSYDSDEMRNIAERRDEILAKCSNHIGVSRAELQNASDNYKSLTDEQAKDILLRIGGSVVSSTLGAVYSDGFFVPTQYDKIIVDAESVFAVGYTSNYQVISGSKEIILCVVFTNDPYVPVFPMVYTAQKGMFELTKSKKGRESIGELFEQMCPNLTYPVGDLKVLKKQLKQDGTVHGNVEMKFMLSKINDASISNGIFDIKEMSRDLPDGSVAMLGEIGYMQEEEINRILKMDKMFNRNFWNKHLKQL